MFVPSFLALWWPKIDRKSGFPQLFAKTAGSIHFIPGIYTYGVSLWNPIDFRVLALIFGPLVAKNWPKIGVSATFRENCRLDSFHPGDLYLWGKSLDPYRFLCSCPHFWPSGGQKLTENRGFRNFSRKLFLRFPNFLYQLQPRYLPYHDTLVGRVMPKFFSNKFFLNDSHQCSYHNDLRIGLFVGYFLMGWVLIRAGVYCPHLWAQLVYSGYYYSDLIPASISVQLVPILPDNKVHMANMGPTWVLSAPGGPHVGPMNFAIRVSTVESHYSLVQCNMIMYKICQRQM